MNQDHLHALPVGTRIQCYEIKNVLGLGGFGITYRAFDHALDLEVAIKEYLPGQMALRANDGATVLPKSETDREPYRHGLKRFLDEACILAKFRHPNIVRVTGFLESHGTAYMIMDYEEGEPLSDFIQTRNQFTEAELKEIFVPLLEGLREVHAKNFLHRDIKPGNIYLRNSGSPVLLDFGAAREGMALRAGAVTAMITPGYAPFEQYHSADKYGPWSDVYATGATLYHCITGIPPVAATDRMAAIHEGEPDPLTNICKVLEGRYSRPFLQTIVWMLRPLAKDRPQTVDEALDALLTAGPSGLMLDTPAAPAANISAAPQNQPKTILLDAPDSAELAWQAEDLHTLETDLAGYVGPIARILIKRAAKKTLDPEVLLEMLAAEISENGEKADFLKAARRRSLRPRVSLD